MNVDRECLLLYAWWYTPDYIIYSKIGLIDGLRSPVSDYVYHIDTKGFNGTHDSKALFSLKQKALYLTHGSEYIF